MKPIKDIEGTRKDYHADAQHNTVHRSSLLAPSIPGCQVDVSFANHFLIKRGYHDIACRLTAISANGERIVSRTYPVDEPRVYAFELDSLTDEAVDNFMVEFFTSSNLFIPFPAVIVNHRNSTFLNSVHSYNRVLNDVFENDEVNRAQVSEASIDVNVKDELDTFAVFTSGPQDCYGQLGVSLQGPSERLEASVAVSHHRLSNTLVSLRETLGEGVAQGGVLTLQQPDQPMFYGRMLAGIRHTVDGAIAANHSFYDCSDVEEYWEDNRPSSRIYPLLPGFSVEIRLYPIFSPCRMLGAIDFLDSRGRALATVQCDPVDCPSSEFLSLSVTEALAQVGVNNAVSFQYRAWPETGGTPKRINHQLVYGDDQQRSELKASVAISLRNPNAFTPNKTKGLVWGQCAISGELDTRVGLTFDNPDGEPASVVIKLLGENGETFEQSEQFYAGAAFVFDPADMLAGTAASGDRPHYVWYWVTAERSDLSAYAITRNRHSGHCSGEHNF